MAHLEELNSGNDMTKITTDTLYHKQSCHDLAVKGKLGSIMYFVIWLLIIQVTPLKQDWPALSGIVLIALFLLGTLRGYTIYRFDSLFTKNPRLWYHIYSFTTLGSSLIWGLMTAMALWHYTQEWTGFLLGFSMAGVVSGGMVSLSTHHKLQIFYICSMLLPSTITCLFIGGPAALSLGALFAADVIYLLMVGRRLNHEYWAALKSNELLTIRAIELDRARENAESLDKAKSLFLSHINHELRTPLNSIIGFGRLLSRSNCLADVDKEHLSIINKNGNYLLKLINHVLELSKIESGKMTPNETSFSLRSTIEELRDMFSIRAQRKNLTLNIVLPDDLPQYILADELKLRQILINLLNNAIKFTDKGKVVLLVSFAMEEELNGVRDLDFKFSVKDTGPGIPEEDLDEIFNSFSQSDVGRQISEGTGLGLTISKKFVEMMGGGIKAYSSLGDGSEFVFNIHAQSAEQLSICPANESRRVTSIIDDFSVLIVDGQSDNRKLLVDILQPVGFNVIEANNGEELLKLLKSFSPDLIWMDSRIPIMNGSYAINVIRENTNGDNIPIIACTSEGFEEIKDKPLLEGFDDFIRKPFIEHDVFEIIERHLNVRYLYSDTAEHLTVETPEVELVDQKVSKEDLAKSHQALRDAVEMGDLELITQAIGAIEVFSPMTARKLSQHCDDFAFDKMLQIISETKS